MKKLTSKQTAIEDIERELCDQSEIVFGKGGKRIRRAVNPQRGYGC